VQVATENVKNTYAPTYYCKILRSQLDWTDVGKKIILPVKFESNYDIVRAGKGQEKCLKKSEFFQMTEFKCSSKNSYLLRDRS